MPDSSSSRFAWWSAATIFLGAFLLFQVQPIISKMILPWFGGGPAVWTTCMLFFQVLLLGGYAYSHYLISSRNLKRQTIIHVVLLIVAAVTLPITPDASWKPLDGTQPTIRILSLLLANVGLPYFILSSTGPLVQAWYARVYRDRSPYRLYALSNIGSLGALLTYPFIVEPALAIDGQGWLWSACFIAYAVLCATLAVAAGKHQPPAEPVADDASKPNFPSVAVPLPEHQLAWVLLPALASVMLLAITNHVCQDVAVVPFFWVVPLSLYLISFIICFDREAWYLRRSFAIVTVAALFFLCLVMMGSEVDAQLKSLWQSVGWSESGPEFKFDDVMSDIVAEAAIYLSVMFLVCMVCHGELVRCKPATRHLTRFYLMVSAGGALGGLFVALICPVVFRNFIEMAIALVFSFLLAIGVLADSFWTTRVLDNTMKKCSAFAVVFGLLLIVVRAQFEEFTNDYILVTRNFYGVLSVDEDEKEDEYFHIHELMNGRILHGSQFLHDARRRMATTYYNEESGVGIAITRFPKLGPKRVATVGLGTGTIASYAEHGDYYCYYEINPNVVTIATDDNYFTYLSDAERRGAKVRIELGDARISMERQEPQAYDIIALDAFSGDAIPAHLLTKESFDEYLRHLGDGGIIAVHVSNRHLDLTPVVGGLAEHFDLPMIRIEWVREDGIDYVGEASSDWLLLTKNLDFQRDGLIVEKGRPVKPRDYQQIPLWTDQFSNLFQILERPKWWTKLKEKFARGNEDEESFDLQFPED